MTDTDIEIDPALDAHLRRTFREIAATVAADDWARVFRLVPTPAPDLPRRRWAWLAAAAAAGVVAGAGLMAVADRDSDRTAVPTASTVPVGGDELQELGVACHEAATRFASDTDWPLMTPVPDLADVDMIRFDTDPAGGDDHLALASDDAFVLCRLRDGRLGPTPDLGLGPVNPTEPPAVGDIQLILIVSGSENGDTGPGDLQILGRAGADVIAVNARLADGTGLPAVLESGWFLVDRALPATAPLNDLRVEWTLSDGSLESSRTDLLDDPDPAEVCAAEPGCVPDELVRLRDEARAGGFDEQAAILEDLVVTDAEHDVALQDFADCFNAADTGATATTHGDGSLAIGTSAIESDSQRQFVDAVHTLCAAAHLDHVDQAEALLDAQRRVEEA